MEGVFWKSGLCFVLVVCLTVTVVRSQDVLVYCFVEPDGSGMEPHVSGMGVSESGMGPTCLGEFNVTAYSDCCIDDNAANINYTVPGDPEATCTSCGPVINESSVIPFSIGDTIILLQWDLIEGSVPVTNYVATSQLTNPPNGTEAAIFGFFLPSDANSVQNINLEMRTNYTFTIRAESSNEGRSPTISVTWITGDSTFPVFVNFTIISATTDSVTANFTLESSGFLPLLSYIIRWREGDNETFPPENIIVESFADEPAEDGDIFNATFSNLIPGIRYLVQINGTNGAGTSSTEFAIEPEEIPTTPSEGSLAVAPGTAVSSYKTSPILLLAATAASMFLLKKLL